MSASFGRNNGYRGVSGAQFYEPQYDRYQYLRPYGHNQGVYGVFDGYNGGYGAGYGVGYGSGVGHGYGSGYQSFGYVPYQSYVYTRPYYPTYYSSTTNIYSAAPPSQSFYDGGVYAPEASAPGVVAVEPERYVERSESYSQGSESYAQHPEPSVQHTEPYSQAPETVGPGTVANDEAPADPTASQPTLVDLGNNAFNAGDYKEALRLYVTAVFDDDTNAEARFFYGLAQFALGDYELANVGIRRALVLDPQLITSPIDVRSIYPDAETFETQRDLLLQYVGENRDDTNAQLLLGFIYYASAQPDMATSFFRSAAETNPNDELAVRLRDQAVAVLASAPAKSKP